MNIKSTTLAKFEIVTGLGLVTFWALFFTVGLAPENAPAGYLMFEHAFPVPDIILALCFIRGGVLLLKNKPEGIVVSIAAGGAFTFLGVLDVSFNIQNGMYSLSVIDTVLAIFINGWSVIFGISVIVNLAKYITHRTTTYGTHK